MKNDFRVAQSLHKRLPTTKCVVPSNSKLTTEIYKSTEVSKTFLLKFLSRLYRVGGGVDFEKLEARYSRPLPHACQAFQFSGSIAGVLECNCFIRGVGLSSE